MTIAYLSLGSNVGDRLGHLAAAVRRLDSPRVRVRQVSSVYQTAPQGKTDQADFLNIAAEVETDLEPAALLLHLQEVERALGRVRHERWGPRTIDIDLALYGDTTVQTPDLEVPHPRMKDRAFVLVPLLEVAPDLALPGAVPLRRCLEALSDQGVSPFLDAASFIERTRGVQ